MFDLLLADLRPAGHALLLPYAGVSAGVLWADLQRAHVSSQLRKTQLGQLGR